MSQDITKNFFRWMEANNITRQEAALLLGLDERSLSTYRSRGLPKRKHARAEQIMEEHLATSPAASAADDNRIRVIFTDEEYDLVERAAKIVGSRPTEFIQKAATFKAKEELEKYSGLKVADDDYPDHQKSKGPVSYKDGTGSGK